MLKMAQPHERKKSRIPENMGLPRNTDHLLLYNIPKEVKDLYSEIYNILMKEIKDDTKRWREISSSWMGRVNIVKITKVHKAIHRFNAIPIT